MKNPLIIYGLLIGLGLFGLFACSGETSNGNRPTQEHRVVRPVNDKISDNYSNLDELSAIKAAQRFIRSEFALNAQFEDDGTIVKETEVPGRFKVLQKFSAENHPSNWSKFIYRIWVQRFEDGKWEFGNLAVESITGENVFTTNGKMKEREQNDGIGDKLTAGGIVFSIAERKPTAIRIYTKNKLTNDKMRNVVKELMNQYDTIQFATDAKHERGDEYASWTSGIFCNFDNNEVLSKDKFFK